MNMLVNSQRNRSHRKLYYGKFKYDVKFTVLISLSEN